MRGASIPPSSSTSRRSRAVVVALGHVATGMMGNDAEAMRLLKDSGERTYERVWELPMFEEYEALIKSEIADVKNTGGRWGGAITAAMFLRKFTGSYGWVHLDIAGTSIIEEPTDYTGRGGSGVGCDSWSISSGAGVHAGVTRSRKEQALCERH